MRATSTPTIAFAIFLTIFWAHSSANEAKDFKKFLKRLQSEIKAYPRNNILPFTQADGVIEKLKETSDTFKATCVANDNAIMARNGQYAPVSALRTVINELFESYEESAEHFTEFLEAIQSVDPIGFHTTMIAHEVDQDSPKFVDLICDYYEIISPILFKNNHHAHVPSSSSSSSSSPSPVHHNRGYNSPSPVHHHRGYNSPSPVHYHRGYNSPSFEYNPADFEDQSVGDTHNVYSSPSPQYYNNGASSSTATGSRPATRSKSKLFSTITSTTKKLFRRGSSSKQKINTQTRAEPEGEQEDGDNTCVICLENMDESEFPKVGVDCCNHLFCQPCIERWMQTNSNCPTCRKHITETVVVPQ